MGYPEASTQALFSFQVQGDGMAPAEVRFINRTINGTDFEWDFGDGQTLVSDADTVYHTYEDAGNFSVVLTASDGGQDLYYSRLKYERVVQISDALYKRLYFTCRLTNNVKYVVLDDSPVPVVQSFDHTGFPGHMAWPSTR